MVVNGCIENVYRNTMTFVFCLKLCYFAQLPDAMMQQTVNNNDVAMPTISFTPQLVFFIYNQVAAMVIC